MLKFKSQYSYSNFEQEVKRNTRYIYGPTIENFLKTVVETSVSRVRVLKRGAILCRAQMGFKSKKWRGSNHTIRLPHPASRMIPVAEYVGSGRANPKGIPCLYLASDEDTAMAEVRPWIGSYISVSKFKLLRPCRVVNCSIIDPRRDWSYGDDEPDASERETRVWYAIADAFSKPVGQDESPLDYVPTQILGEAFRNAGYDGVQYRSLLGPGTSTALFSVSFAKIMGARRLYETIGGGKFDYKELD